MIAYISSRDGTSTTWVDEYSGTTTWANSGNDGPCGWYDDPGRYDVLMPFLAADVPWLFDFDKPWRSPVHYPEAPKAIKPIKSAPLKINHIIKQPGPMRRGNRI